MKLIEEKNAAIGHFKSTLQKRMVRWGSTSSRASTEEIDFKGKFVMICNSFPETPDGDAIRSRSFQRPIHITAGEAQRLLMEAAKDKQWYEDTKVAKEVATYLCERLSSDSVWKISFRLLQMGYELAVNHPEDWGGISLLRKCLTRMKAQRGL